MDKHPTKKGQEQKEETKKFFKMLHDLFEKIVPKLVSRKIEISAGAIGMFWALIERANFFHADFNDYFFVTDSWLMKALNVKHRSTISSYRKELMESKLIYCIPGKHRGCASTYFISYPFEPKKRIDPMKRIRNWEKRKAKLLRQYEEYERV